MAGGRFIDTVIYNTETPPPDMIERYAQEGEHPIMLPRQRRQLYLPQRFRAAQPPWRLLGAPLLAEGTGHTPQATDALRRTMIRHKPRAIERAVMHAYYS
jgi:hypothetical protein